VSGKQSKIRALVEPAVEALGCELWGLEYLSQGRHSVVRLYIDTAAGVTLTDCEKVSRQVSSLLDVEDPINGEYTLEVSSPGLDRPLYTLEHYERFAGEMVTVKLRAPFDGRRKFTGRLSGVENSDVVIQVDGEEYLLPIESIEAGNLVPNFSE